MKGETKGEKGDVKGTKFVLTSGDCGYAREGGGGDTCIKIDMCLYYAMVQFRSGKSSIEVKIFSFSIV